MYVYTRMHSYISVLFMSVQLRVAIGATQIPLKIKKKSLMSKRKDIDKKFSASYSSTALQIKLVTRMISSDLVGMFHRYLFIFNEYISCTDVF